MNEGRVILIVFAVAGLLMIALPISMLLSANHAADPNLDGDVATFFTNAPKPAAGTRQVLPEIVKVLPAGLSADESFKKMAASGFTCVPDARSASCFRGFGSGCGVEWRVSLVFDDHNSLQRSEADRRTTCP